MAGHWGGIGLARSSVLWQLGSGHWGIPLFFGHFFWSWPVFGFLLGSLDLANFFVVERGVWWRLAFGVDGGGSGVPL